MAAIFLCFLATTADKMMFVLDGHVLCHNEVKLQVILILFSTLLNWMLDLLWLTSS
jgi:hypothetical protein